MRAVLDGGPHHAYRSFPRSKVLSVSIQAAEENRGSRLWPTSASTATFAIWANGIAPQVGKPTSGPWPTCPPRALLGLPTRPGPRPPKAAHMDMRFPSTPKDGPDPLAECRKAGPELTVCELCAAYLDYAEGYYIKDGRPTDQVGHVRRAIRVVNQLYGHTPPWSSAPRPWRSSATSWSNSTESTPATSDPSATLASRSIRRAMESGGYSSGPSARNWSRLRSNRPC